MCGEAKNKCAQDCMPNSKASHPTNLVGISPEVKVKGDHMHVAGHARIKSDDHNISTVGIRRYDTCWTILELSVYCLISVSLVFVITKGHNSS